MVCHTAYTGCSARLGHGTGITLHWCRGDREHAHFVRHRVGINVLDTVILPDGNQGRLAPSAKVGQDIDKAVHNGGAGASSFGLVRANLPHEHLTQHVLIVCS